MLNDYWDNVLKFGEKNRDLKMVGGGTRVSPPPPNEF